MAVLKLVIFPDERLTRQTNKVEVFDGELKALVDDMFESMYHNKGIGLAANQVGIDKSIFVMDVSDIDGASSLNDARYCFINPVIKKVNGKREYEEGCLSFPGQHAIIERPDSIMVEYQDLQGNTNTLFADGIAATCIQHETDHLNGIVMPDRVKSSLKKEMMIKKAKKVKNSV